MLRILAQHGMRRSNVIGTSHATCDRTKRGLAHTTALADGLSGIQFTHSMTARDVVTVRIAAQARRFPDVDLSPLDTTGLDERDAGLAAAIEHAVMRRWLTLATVVESQLSRPWAKLEAKLQAVLLVGAAQLLMLERLPDHAVINEAVEWAKSNVRFKAGGLVNAVLRKVANLRGELRASTTVSKAVSEHHSEDYAPFERDEMPLHDGRVWKFTAPVFASDPVRRLAQQTSHPERLLAHWLTVHGHAQTITLALHSLVHAPILIHGISDAAASPALQPHEEPGFFVFTGERSSLRDFLASHPDAIVQDPTSAAPAIASASLHPPPSLIIDACAGKGTKTRQLAAAHPHARIVASDIDEQRFAILREQFAHHDRVQVVAYRHLREFDAQADLVFLDVPCSNTGVLARRVEAKYRLSEQSIRTLADLQRQIMADSLPLLTQQGRLVYSTCSIEPAENQRQAEWLCRWHPFTILQARVRLPQSVPGDPPQTYADGGYFAIFQRTG